MITIICPLIGTILTLVMWASPLKAVLKAREEFSLKSLNPIPFTVTVFNCIGWSTFGLLKRDWFIFIANSTGLVAGLYYSISSLAILYRTDASAEERKLHRLVEGLLLGAVSVWLFVGMIIAIGAPDTPQSKAAGVSAVGAISCTAGMLYYASPLSTMRTVIATQDSSSLYFPTIITSFVTAFMWFIYGLLGFNDPILWVPNLIGALLSATQLFLSFYYPKKPTGSDVNLNSGKDEKYVTSNNEFAENPMWKSSPINSVSSDLNKAGDEDFVDSGNVLREGDTKRVGDKLYLI